MKSDIGAKLAIYPTGFMIGQQIKILWNFLDFTGERPLQQIIDIFKMVIKRIAIDITILYQFTHCDSGKGYRAEPDYRICIFTGNDRTAEQMDW